MSYYANVNANILRTVPICIILISTPIDRYKEKVDMTNDLEEKLRARDERANRLQESLSELQGCMFDERENYLKLVKDNEQLKVLTILVPAYRTWVYHCHRDRPIAMKCVCPILPFSSRTKTFDENSKPSSS
jgi:hypothetical protein